MVEEYSGWHNFITLFGNTTKFFTLKIFVENFAQWPKDITGNNAAQQKFLFENKKKKHGAPSIWEWSNDRFDFMSGTIAKPLVYVEPASTDQF